MGIKLIEISIDDAEKSDKIIMRMNQSFTHYYFIEVDGITVGAIRVVDKKIGKT